MQYSLKSSSSDKKLWLDVAMEKVITINKYHLLIQLDEPRRVCKNRKAYNKTTQ